MKMKNCDNFNIGIIMYTQHMHYSVEWLLLINDGLFLQKC